MNPDDPWAWIGLAGDIIDVAVPFVGGLGEATRAISAATEVIDTVDDIHDAGKTADRIEDAAEACQVFPGGLCFVAGTEVHTQNGNKAIESIVAGDLVWAWDELTGDVALKKVIETYINKADELVHIFVNGEEIITTPTHPFYSPIKGWVTAAHLYEGDLLVLISGEYVFVEKVQHEKLDASVAVYNFQVEDYHTYFVSGIGILVHNKCTKNVNLTMSRSDAIKKGKEFLGENYRKTGPGEYISQDGYRTMRFDFTHHDKTPAHINLVVWKNVVEKGQRNKVRKNIHIFFDHY